MKTIFKRAFCLLLCTALLSASAVFASAEQNADYTPVRVTACMAGDDGKTIGLCWYTKAQPTETSIEILTQAGAPAQGAHHSQVQSSEWNGMWMSKATLYDLSAATAYKYVIECSGETATGSFTTGGDDGEINFITIADVQASSLENFQKGAATLSAALDMQPDSDFVVNCGDFTNDSTNEEWDLYDTAFSEMNRANLLVPVSGNHDGLGVADWFNNMFNLDTSESVQTKDGVNYSFDYGNSHFAVLNTNDCLSISNAQLKWLKNDMNSTDCDWKIVFMHKSPYTLGKDGKWPDAMYLQKSLTKVLDECNVDLVMSGHDHQYLRTKGLTGNELDENGVTYVLAGTAGSKRYEARSFLAGHFMNTDFIDAFVVQKNGYGNFWNGIDWSNKNPENVGGCFSLINISGGTLTLNAYILGDESGQTKLIDTYTVTKATGKNKITYTGDNTTSAVEYSLSKVGSYACLATYALTVWLPKFLFMLPDLLMVYIKDGTF